MNKVMASSSFRKGSRTGLSREKSNLCSSPSNFASSTASAPLYDLFLYIIPEKAKNVTKKDYFFFAAHRFVNRRISDIK